MPSGPVGPTGSPDEWEWHLTRGTRTGDCLWLWPGVNEPSMKKRLRGLRRLGNAHFLWA